MAFVDLLSTVLLIETELADADYYQRCSCIAARRPKVIYTIGELRLGPFFSGRHPTDEDGSAARPHTAGD